MVGARFQKLALSLLTVILVGLTLFIGELVIRGLDGYSVFAWRLIGGHINIVPGGNLAKQYVGTIPLAEGMKVEWFDIDPDPISAPPPDPLFQQAFDLQRAAGAAKEAGFVFNSQFALSAACGNPELDKFPGFLFVFDAPNEFDRPRYRYPPNIHIERMVTNQFGFRGRPIELRKPDNTIRIAFIGSSTTVNADSYPFSYPDLVGFWLNLWARESGLNVKIEIINGGRTGINIDDEVAIFRDELSPFEPDFALFDGATNGFTPSDIIDTAGVSSVLPTHAADAASARLWLYDHSAIGRRLLGAGVLPLEVPEPPKPAYKIRWPEGLSASAPEADSPLMPHSIANIVKAVNEIRIDAERAGTQLALTSYFFFAFDGMRLNPITSLYLYDSLNVTYFPYHYAELQRMTNFLNTVYQAYGKLHRLPYIDFGKYIPHNPLLFTDPVHTTYDGVRLQAWIVAQQLAPLLRQQIAAGRLPRPMKSGITNHPAFPGNERSVTFDCARLTTGFEKLDEPSLDKAKAALPMIKTSFSDRSLRVTADDKVPQGAYLVLLPVTDRVYPNKSFVLDIELGVSAGEVNVGIMSKDSSKFLAYQLVTASSGPAQVKVPFFSPEGTFGPVIITKVNATGQAVALEVKSASVWSGAPRSSLFKEYARGLAPPPGNIAPGSAAAGSPPHD